MPIGKAEKSTTTSTRSADPSEICVRATGSGSRPPSEAICVIAAPSSRSRNTRSVAQLSSRNRYLRAATAKYGWLTPLASSRGRSNGEPKTSCPDVSSTLASRSMIGTSYWPRGSPSASSSVPWIW